MSIRIAIFKLRYHLIRKKKLADISSPEEYVKFLQGLSKSCELEISDKFALYEPDTKGLFACLPWHNELKKLYSLDTVAAGETVFEKAKSVMYWLNNTTFYSGMSRVILPDDTLQILKAAYNKPFNFAINCRHRAIVFSDCLLSLGIKVYPVLLVSKSKEVHFVTQVFLPEQNKWCVFDPSFNCFFTDNDGNFMDVFELRRFLLDGKELVANGYALNGKQECYDIYMDFFIKQCLSNISTWKDTSRDKKCKNKIFGKAFDYKLPL